MNEHDIQDAILEHLREVAIVKRTLLQIAIDISPDFPTQGKILLRVIRGITTSADRLLGDTSVS